MSIRSIKASAKPCCRCGANNNVWDKVGPHPICYECQEKLAANACEVWRFATRHGRCAVCDEAQVVPFASLPVHAGKALEIELCGQHLRDVLGRRLSKRAFRVLRAVLEDAGISTGEIFLLHGAFYNERGNALQPVEEAET